MTVIGVLPAAGQATRMGGLPKFLLPVLGESRTILEYHIRLMCPFVDQVMVPTRKEWKNLLDSFAFGEKVQVIEVDTESPFETVALALAQNAWDVAIIGLPDTVFDRGNPYETLIINHLGEDLALACFETQDFQRGGLGAVKISDQGVVLSHLDKPAAGDWTHHWGIMMLTSAASPLIRQDASKLGDLIDEFLVRDMRVAAMVHDSTYFDCGTPEQYARLLQHQLRETGINDE